MRITAAVVLCMIFPWRLIIEKLGSVFSETTLNISKSMTIINYHTSNLVNI